jgi:hypothetical protein
VIRVPNEASAAERARWLGQVGEALEEAGRVVRQLNATVPSIAAVELHNRIDALAADVEMMRCMRGGPNFGRIDPEWMKNIPWSLSA